jgi:hypothetical protein
MPEIQVVNILVEPIFYSRYAFIRWLKKNIFITKWPFAEKKTKMFLRIEQRDVDVLDSLAIASIQITDREKSYSSEPDNEFIIRMLKKNVFIYLGKIKIVFPFPGLYWIDVRFCPVPGIALKTKQMTLSGIWGRGEANYEENTCRNPIIVKDLSNRRMLIYTCILLLLTIVLAIDAIPRLFQTLKCLF